jgi:hypothetical protein
MTGELQVYKKDTFNYVYTKTRERKDFARELEEIYNKHYKKNYEQDGFRKGEVPFNVAVLNGKLSSSVLKTVALTNRQIFIEEIIKNVSDEGSIYDIKEGADQTNFGELDLSSEEPIVFQLDVELASFVDKVNYKEVKVDPETIKSKRLTEKEMVDVFKEYKKIKQKQNKATKTSYVDLVFDDGKDKEELTFNLAQKFTESDEPLKTQTHKEIVELTIGKKVGDEFPYALTGKDGSKLDINASIRDIYRIKELKDEEFVEMLKEQDSIPEEQKQDLNIDKIKIMFNNHLESIYQENFTEEIRSLTFAALNNATEGIHYNENEINNLKNQFIVQVQKMADKEGLSFVDYVTKNFGNQRLMEDYIDASQRTRVLQAAIYRKIGKDEGYVPTYMQLEAFVKTFLFKIDVQQEMDPGLTQQVNQQVTQVLSEPLNRQRIVESWASVKAEDMISEQIGLF